MFEKRKRQQLIEFLEKYLEINNIPYNEKEILEKFSEFDDYYKPLELKCSLGDMGYQEYTESYVFMKKIELLTKMFDEYYSLHSWAQGLKMYLMTSNKKIVKESGLTAGQEQLELTPTEILLNEQVATKKLAQLKIQQQSDEIYKRR